MSKDKELCIFLGNFIYNDDILFLHARKVVKEFTYHT